MADVEFGLIIRASAFGLPIRPEELPDYNRRCIQAVAPAFTTLWAEDHLQWDGDETLECFTTLSYLAAQFPRFRVGNLVLCQSYRNPALVAKMAANVHFLSGGRYILGIGAGWKSDEYQAYGYPIPDMKTRWEQLEEALAIIRSMWTTSPATFIGKHYQVENVYCVPSPSPAIPIMLGGGGEQRTLALVARYADWWNYNSCPPAEYARKAAKLKEHCARVGRSPDEITFSYSGTVSISENPDEITRHPRKHIIAGNSQEIIRQLEEYYLLGVRHFMFRFSTFAGLELFVSTVAPYFVA